MNRERVEVNRERVEVQSAWKSPQIQYSEDTEVVSSDLSTSAVRAVNRYTTR